MHTAMSCFRSSTRRSSCMRTFSVICCTSAAYVAQLCIAPATASTLSQSRHDQIKSSPSINGLAKHASTRNHSGCRRTRSATRRMILFKRVLSRKSLLRKKVMKDTLHLLSMEEDSVLLVRSQRFSGNEVRFSRWSTQTTWENCKAAAMIGESEGPAYEAWASCTSCVRYGSQN